MRRARLWVLMGLLCCGATWARADAALFLAEPFGGYGRMNPTGHAAIYLSQICAASPIRLRPCRDDEAGVVISRYHHIAGYDWIAIPLVPYLYAVDEPEQVPLSVDAATVGALREAYRRKHLREIVPDTAQGQAPGGEWMQLVGAAYDRRLYGFQIETTREQDEKLIRRFNSRRNRSHFNLFFHNCADFARSILNFYYPSAVHRSLLADVGITTPKQAARSLVDYSRRHPEFQFYSYIIPQIPGSVPRSTAVRGVMESIVKSKKYVVPLAVFHPLIASSFAVGFLARGRFTPGRNAPALDAREDLQPQILAAQVHPHTTRPREPIPFGSAPAGESGAPAEIANTP